MTISHSPVLIPFAKKILTGEIVGIDDVPNGLACECECISCKMTLEARQGSLRVHHFSHFKQAETECQISYWVSIRSLAEQILEQASLIYTPPLTCNDVSPAIISIHKVDKKRSEIHQFTFDLRLETSTNEIFIYFITEEGRSRDYCERLSENSPETFILEIDICSTQTKHYKDIKEYLQYQLINEITNKKWVVREKTYNSIYEQSLQTIVQHHTLPTQTNHRIKLDDYRDLLLRLEIDCLDKLDSEDLKTCAGMLNYYKGIKTGLEEKTLWKVENKIGKNICIALIRHDYIIYDVNIKNEIILVQKEGSLFKAKSFIRGNYIYPPVIITAQQRDEQTYSMMIRAWNIMYREYIKKPKVAIKNYRIVQEAFNILFVHYLGEYFCVAKVEESFLIYRVIKGEIEQLARVFSEEELKEKIKEIVYSEQLEF